MSTNPALRPRGKTLLRETRRSNRRLLLQEIFDRGPISRADLARSTGLGRATVSDIASDLIGQGLVAETGPGQSTGGKPPTMIELDPEGRVTIAVDLSRHPIEAALLNLRGRIVARWTGKTLSPTGRIAMQELHRLIAEILGESGAPALGIGVGVPGAVDSSGHVVTAAQLDWFETPLRDELEDIYGVPTYVVGDAEAAVLGEVGRTGSGPADRVLYVKVDDRIAIAMVTSDRLNRTPNHGGDLTHLRMHGWRDMCECGERGCLGTRVAMINILGPDYLDMSSEARTRLAVETAPQIDRSSEYLGRALAPMVAGLDADRVIVGGQLGEWASVPAHVARGISTQLGWSPEVSVSRLGQSAVVLGAAAMVLSAELGVVWG